MVDPIEAAAYKVAVTIKKWNPEIIAHVEDIRYGAAFYINHYCVIIISLIIGFFTNELLWTSVSLLSFGILRKYTGGFHLKSLTGCAVVTVILLSSIPHIHIYNFWVTAGLNITSILLIVLFVDTRTNRYMGVLLITTNLIFASPTVSLAFLAQSLTLIKFRKGGEHT